MRTHEEAPEQLTGDRVHRPDLVGQALAAQLSRAALARELSVASLVPPTAGQRIVIEPAGTVEFESLAASEANWDGWGQKLVGQLERRGRPTALFDLESDMVAAGWPSISPNGLLLQLVAACKRGQIRHSGWGDYAPAGYDCQSETDRSSDLPTVPARLLDVLAWAQGALRLPSVVSSMAPQPSTLENLAKEVRPLRRSGRIYQQGPNLYALAEYSIEGIHLSKRGLVAAVVDQLLAVQGGGVRVFQVKPLADQVTQSLAGRVDESVLCRLAVARANIREYLNELVGGRRLKKVDDQTYIQPDCDLDQVRLPNPVRSPPRPRSKPKPRPKPVRPEAARPQDAAPDLDQRIINALEVIKHQQDPTVSKRGLFESVNADGHQQYSTHHFTKRLAALYEADSIQRPRLGVYAAKGAAIERRSAGRAAPGLGRRIMRIVRQLDDEDLFDSDKFLLDDLFERVSLDGSGPVSRSSFDALAGSMIRRHRGFRRDSVGDGGDE